MLTLARNAMATRFEIVLPGTNTTALRAAGEEALDEIERLHHQLSLYSPSSEIAQVNSRAAHGPVRVDPRVFALLKHAQQLHQQTGGVFDITIAPLMRCWGFMGGSGSMPTPEAIAAARSIVGMDLVQLNEDNYTVQFVRPGVMIDLGAIGKGYAIERAAMVLREAGIDSAFLHGGTSTSYGLGVPPDAPAWKVAIEKPDPHWQHKPHGTPAGTGSLAFISADQTPEPGNHDWLTVVELQDQSLSVSAIWGKFFHSEHTAYGHIIDPRTGHPASRAILSAVVLPSATETDALSTALLTAGIAGFDTISTLRPSMRSLVAEPQGNEFVFCRRGM